MTDQPNLTPTFQYKRMHLPSGHEYTGTFNASHDSCFADPAGYPMRHIQARMLDLVNAWNRQQPKTWKYWV